MQPFLTFANDHQNIRSTNYFDSESAAKGFLYLSWNAGAGRLLIPDNQLHMLAEMRTGKYVVVSAGPWPEQRRTNGLELMFEDNTDSPFSWHFGAEQCDRMLPSKDEGGGFVITAWGRDGLLASWPGKFRKVKRIPCLLPWAGACVSNKAKTRTKQAQTPDVPLKAVQACGGASPAASSHNPAFDQVARHRPSRQSERNDAINTMNHITLTTGHNRVSPRSEVHQDTIKMMTPWMLKALADGKSIPLPGPLGEKGFHAHLSVDAGALLCTLFGTQTFPLLTFGVAVDEGQSDVLWGRMCKEYGAGKGLTKPAAPLCAVTLHAGFIAGPDMEFWSWAGDFERCVAWAFIEKMK